ncbi:hypothetical protein [Metabacillus malikii]|uniref:Uncharacterized protein n=1 Tax=Metabacillus malikii TaxID=1504265 RepID=A0ABT9ZJJ4_9BACI|nr:hypothetical protein [Metabacillus malikii]MDQ0232456.1 hypothetical protein [Metabacillus malikii]
MERINLMGWILEVDINKTEEFYNKNIDLCNCLYCKNYMEACKYFNHSILKVFNMLRIIPSKPSHLSEFGEVDGGLCLYAGSYHVVGKLIEGVYCTNSDWNETNTARIENFTIGFPKELEFVHNELPQPMLQIDFEARIPWVLDEKP